MDPKKAFEVFDTWYNSVFFPEELKCVKNSLNRLEELEKENKFLTKELKKQDKEIMAIEILKTYILKDRLFYQFGSEITYVGLKMPAGVKMPAYEFYYAMPTDKAKIIKEVFGNGQETN